LNLLEPGEIYIEQLDFIVHLSPSVNFIEILMDDGRVYLLVLALFQLHCVLGKVFSSFIDLFGFRGNPGEEALEPRIFLLPFVVLIFDGHELVLLDDLL